MNAHITNGQDGFIVIESGTPATGVQLTVIKAVGGDVVIDEATGNFPAGALDGKTISDRDFIPGLFTAVSVSSGVLLGFK